MSYASRARDSIFSVDERGDLIVNNAVIFWTNFAGAPDRFHSNGGYRSFNLAIPEDWVRQMEDDGWRIKTRDPRDDQDDVLYYTEIVLKMDSRYEPRVMLGSEWNGKKSMNRLHGDTVGKLDGIRYENVDLVIHPRRRDDGGCKGYCNTIVMIQAKSDLFGGKYDDYEMYDGDEADPEDAPF